MPAGEQPPSADGRRIGFVGLGGMGGPMASNLLAAGFPVAGYNRTASKAEALAAAGLEPRATAGAAVEAITFLSLYDDDALMAVLEGPDGVAAACSAQTVVVDTSTVGPATSARAAELVGARGAAFLRCPVSGGVALARTAKISLLCSGPRAAYEACAEPFAAIGKSSRYLGEGEESRYAKLALNGMIATSMQMIAEALSVAEAAGLDRAEMLELMADSAVGSPFVAYKASPLLAGDYSPTFPVEGLRDDLRLLFDVCDDLGVPVPAVGLVDGLLRACEANGWAELDFAALYLLQRRLAGRDDGPSQRAT